jgi:hypothetical protein
MGAEDRHNLGPQVHENDSPWSAALSAMQRAWLGCALYGAEHPAVVEAAQSAAQAAARATRDGGAVLGVTAEHFLLDGEPVATGAGVRQLAAHLHKFGIAAIELTPAAASPESAHAFAIALGEADRFQLSGQALAQYISEKTDGHVALLPLSFAPLKLASGQRTAPRCGDAAGEPRTHDWDGLVSALLASPVGGHAEPPGLRLAKHFDEEVAAEPQAAVANWRDRLRGLADQLPTLDRDQHSAMAEHLRGFVGGLSPGLRRALLRIDRNDPQPSLRLLHEVADGVPVAQVLEALRNLDQVHGQPSKEALRLCRKLAHVSRDSQEDHDGVVATLHRWQAAADIPADTSAELEQSLREIMHTRSDVDFSPEAYQAQLDRLADKVEPAPAARHLPDHLDSHTVKLHAAQVAIELAASTPPGELDGPGLFDHVGATLDRMIVDGQLPLIVSALDAAATHGNGPADDQTAEAARRLLAAITESDRLNRMLESSGGKDDAASSLWQAMVRHGGPVALACLARKYAGQSEGPLRPMLAAAIIGSPVATLRAAIVAMTAARDAALPALIELICTMPPDRAAPLLIPLAQSTSASMRVSAMTALRRVHADWPDEIALAALRDDEPALQRLAVEHLTAHGGEHQLDMLAAFIADRLGGAAPDEAAFEAAVAGMLQHPQLGLPRLAAALRAMCGTLRPARAARARRLVRSLRPRRGDRDVRRALFRWRVSPASWVAVLLPHDPGEMEAAA